VTRIVLDTNVLISSFFGGKPRQMIDLWSTGKIRLCLSRAIVDEYRTVLARMNLLDKPVFLEVFRLLSSGRNCLYAASTPALRVVAADPDDDKFIECAVALEVEAIVTGDKALAAVGTYFGTIILSPAGFLEWFSSRQTDRLP